MYVNSKIKSVKYPRYAHKCDVISELEICPSLDNNLEWMHIISIVHHIKILSKYFT